jgi:uncharacterized membrane protein YraQ (UPF0718 family)
MNTEVEAINLRLNKTEIRGGKIRTVFHIFVLGLLIIFLITYKGSAGIIKIRYALATGRLTLPTIQKEQASFAIAATHDAISYLKIVWPALLFGVLISAAARTTFLQFYPRISFGGGILREQITGALAGVPLMLCSCCVAPLFPSIYQRTRKIGPALALTLASPSLNPIALTLSFVLFPWRVAGARVGMALVLVLIGSLLAAATTVSLNLPFDIDESASVTNWRQLFSSYLDSLVYVALRTVPLIIAGIWVSMSFTRLLPLHQFPTTIIARIFGIALVSLIALLLTLPSLFEIPLALSILAAGGPSGAAAAILFAGPAINLSSLLVIGRYSNWRVSAALALVVWFIAMGGGLMLR